MIGIIVLHVFATHCQSLWLELLFCMCLQRTVKVCDLNYCSACVCDALSTFFIRIISSHVFAMHCQRLSLEFLFYMCLRCTFKVCDWNFYFTMHCQKFFMYCSVCKLCIGSLVTCVIAIFNTCYLTLSKI